MRSLGLLCLRIVAGGILLAHGYTKLFGGAGHRPPEFLRNLFGPNFAPAVEATGPEAFGETLERLDVPAPKTVAYLSGAAEFAGGLALALGYRTRVAAPVVIGNMAAAIRKVHWEKGLYGEGGYEFPLLLAASAGTLLLTGPGNISLDAVSHAAHTHSNGAAPTDDQ